MGEEALLLPQKISRFAELFILKRKRLSRRSKKCSLKGSKINAIAFIIWKNLIIGM